MEKLQAHTYRLRTLAGENVGIAGIILRIRNRLHTQPIFPSCLVAELRTDYLPAGSIRRRDTGIGTAATGSYASTPTTCRPR